MKFDPKIHHRRSIRLKGYDYCETGGYFVTLVTQGREMLFGDIVNGEMRLNDFGKIVADTWQWLETQYPYVALGEWVVMPNHFHGIIVIVDNADDSPMDRDGLRDGRGGSRSAPTPPGAVKRKPLGRLIGAFKTVSTKNINLARKIEGCVVWQRNYYEHIIRNEADADRNTRYIQSNPAQWNEDNENPDNS